MRQRSYVERPGRLSTAGARTGAVACLLAFGCGEPGGGPAGGGASACVGTEVVTAKRVVRLTEHQLWNAYTSRFGASGAATITRDEDPPSLVDREFPPISGDIGVSDVLLGKIDRLAQAAMTYLSRNAAALTPCGAAPTDKACV